jgi:hypothetical protein
MYRDFISSYKITTSPNHSSAFVYVDNSTESIFYLSDMVECADKSLDVLALSIGTKGEIELMVTE